MSVLAVVDLASVHRTVRTRRSGMSVAVTMATNFSMIARLA